MFFLLEFTSELLDELASLDIFSFEGETMAKKWTKNVHHTAATQSLAGKRHRGDTQACSYLMKAIESLEAFEIFDFKRLRHSVHAFYLDSQA